jgi:hypothetical protein
LLALVLELNRLPANLDALELFYSEDDLDTLVLAAGDADYVEVMQRLRSKGKRLFVITLEKNFASELLPYLTGHAIIEKELTSIGYDLIDYSPLLKFLYNLQQFHHSKTGGFVAASLYMRKLEEYNIVTQNTAKSLLSQMIENNVIAKYTVENPSTPEHPTSAIKLNESSEVVKNFIRNYLD